MDMGGMPEVRHEMEFELTGTTMEEVRDRLAEIANHFFGVGQWDYSMATLRPGGGSGFTATAEQTSYTHPRFRTTVTIWET